MSDEMNTSKADADAEKAYAEAAAKSEATPAAKTDAPALAEAPVAPVIAAPVAKAPAKAAPAKAAKPKAPAKPAPAKPVSEPAAKAKPVAKPATKAKKKAATKALAPAAAARISAAKTATKTTKKTAATATKPAVAAPTAAKKETKIMTTTTDFTSKIQSAMKDASEKAKVYFEKGQASFADVPEFAKGNVEAVVESTKILAAGLQDMGKSYVEESKAAFETMTADVKDLAAVKSPTEFFEKQSELARKNFDAAVAATSKNSEAMLKLVNEAFQPLSTRMSLAIEKAKKAA